MTLGTPTRAYLDANAVIDMIEGDGTSLAFLVDRASTGRVHLVTSEFTLAEVLVGTIKQNRPDLAEIYEAFITSSDLLTVVLVDRTALRKSAEVRATLGNKGPDAIHVATALLADCTVFVSSDDRIRLPGGLMQLRVESITHPDRWP